MCFYSCCLFDEWMIKRDKRKTVRKKTAHRDQNRIVHCIHWPSIVIHTINKNINKFFRLLNLTSENRLSEEEELSQCTEFTHIRGEPSKVVRPGQVRSRRLDQSASLHGRLDCARKHWNRWKNRLSWPNQSRNTRRGVLLYFCYGPNCSFLRFNP